MPGRSRRAATAAAVVLGLAVLAAGCSGPPARASVSATPAAPPTPGRTIRAAPGGTFEVAGPWFVDRTHGWAVGRLPCAHGGGQCTALLAAADHRHWYVEPVRGDSPFGVPVSRCGPDCVAGVAFAMAATARTVARLSASHGADCLPGCRYRLQWASAVAPGVWHTTRLPAAPEQFGTSLVGVGDHMYFLAYGHIAGGEPSAQAELLVSGDDGRTWDNRASALATPPAPPPDCTASQLRVRGGRQGAPFGTAAGDIEFTDIGAACRLHGLPRIVIRDRSGTALQVQRKAAPAATTRTVELRPDGGTVRLPLSWDNWCGPAPGPLTITVTLPGSGDVLNASFDGPPDYDYVPGCIAPYRASTLQPLGYTRVH